MWVRFVCRENCTAEWQSAIGVMKRDRWTADAKSMNGGDLEQRRCWCCCCFCIDFFFFHLHLIDDLNAFCPICLSNQWRWKLIPEGQTIREESGSKTFQFQVDFIVPNIWFSYQNCVWLCCLDWTQAYRCLIYLLW